MPRTSPFPSVSHRRCRNLPGPFFYGQIHGFSHARPCLLVDDSAHLDDSLFESFAWILSRALNVEVKRCYHKNLSDLRHRPQACVFCPNPPHYHSCAEDQVESEGLCLL